MGETGSEKSECTVVAGTEENSSRYFRNTACEYYPCHDTGGGGFNCLFCYCPMYYGYCPGDHEYVQVNGALVKDCTGCDFPHRPENYDMIVGFLRELLVGT